ncbi:hypothetical protein EDB51_12194 [Vibrio crassostreae]|uniref:hypothetical protein n=1 Tax=Vibrio crassostreae TaxID=246167 RepID=UPI00104B8D91|nr:hypothetical protein [Vibrio crassostreae]TCN93937.1 hypothetical protein EDB51_12194 [Vibrio crassostreae]CAK3383265.1 SIR2-like protein [Vibrio crassostreae]
MITLIFGAGASYGSGRCIPDNPPLGMTLYDELTSLNGAFSRLNGEIKEVFEEQGFEHGMAKIPNHSEVINQLQKELACYLSSFSITNENAYVRLFNRLKWQLDHINIVTLNYDILIEQALNIKGFNVDYNGSNNGVNVLKPHGSSNFLPHLPNDFNINGFTAIDCNVFVEGLPTRAVFSHADIKSWCNDPKNKDLSPSLSLYNKDKRVVINSDLIKHIQDRYVKIISDSDLIVLVGIKYIPHDEHIWHPLESIDSPIVVVDPYPSDISNWATRCKKDNVKIIEKGFDDSVWELTKLIRNHTQ